MYFFPLLCLIIFRKEKKNKVGSRTRESLILLLSNLNLDFGDSSLHREELGLQRGLFTLELGDLLLESSVLGLLVRKVSPAEGINRG